MPVQQTWVRDGQNARPFTSAGRKTRVEPHERLHDGDTVPGEPERDSHSHGEQGKTRWKTEDGTRQVARLLCVESDNLCNQLLIASEKGRFRAVFLLLHQGVDKDRCKGLLGYSPLHHAAARGHLDVVKLLLDFGWSVNTRNDALETPLHLASFGGHAHVAELLLDRGAAINAHNSEHETPLFYAARRGNYRIVRLHVRRECDLEVTNCYGDTAEDEARDDKTLAEFAVGNEDLQRASGLGALNDIGEHTLSQQLRERVLSYLDLKSLGCASQVCYRWHRAADSSTLWKRLGVSRWGLLLNATMGVGTVPAMATLRASGGGLHLNLSTIGSCRPSSCDQEFFRRLMPLSAKPRERIRHQEEDRPRTANVLGV